LWDVVSIRVVNRYHLQLNDKWALQRLLDVLNLTDGVIQFDSAVAERLARLASTYPDDAVVCLEKMIEGDRDGWRILGWRQHAREILDNGLKSGSKTAQEAAVRLINKLGDLGHLEFRDLLED